MGALWTNLMENATTKEVGKGLKKLELRLGEISGISRNSGSNLLEQNLNPILATLNGGQRKQR